MDDVAKKGVKVIAHDQLIKSAHRTYDGRELKLGASSICEAIEEGIAIVHQELTLVPNMTVGENIFLGKEPCNGVASDWNRLYSETAALLKRFQLDISLCTH